MNNRFVLAAALAAAFATATLAGPFEAFKGKIKDGMYEYKMDTDMGAMPGIPPGMAKRSHTFQHCVSKKDIDEGEFAKKEGKGPDRCEIKDFKMSGNTATYTMVCKGESGMKADNKITFASDGFVMDMKMAMSHNGQPMNLTQHMEGKYLGPCK